MRDWKPPLHLFNSCASHSVTEMWQPERLFAKSSRAEGGAPFPEFWTWLCDLNGPGLPGRPSGCLETQFPPVQNGSNDDPYGAVEIKGDSDTPHIKKGLRNPGLLDNLGTSLVAQTLKNPPATKETWGPSLGWEGSLEKGTATHSSILAWRIPWAEEPGGVQSVGSQRVWHDWATFSHWTI